MHIWGKIKIKSKADPQILIQDSFLNESELKENPQIHGQDSCLNELELFKRFNGSKMQSCRAKVDLEWSNFMFLAIVELHEVQWIDDWDRFWYWDRELRFILINLKIHNVLVVKNVEKINDWDLFLAVRKMDQIDGLYYFRMFGSYIRSTINIFLAWRLTVQNHRGFGWNF